MDRGVRKLNERFIAGDPLRGIACFVVVFWHVTVALAQITGQGKISPGFKAELGVAGLPIAHLAMIVMFFFALSGYLIGRPFVAAVVRDDARRPNVRSYARNRVLRIVPAYWGIILLTILLVGLAGDRLARVMLFFFGAHVYWQGPFTERIVHAWTLDVEIVFYLLAPLLLVPLARVLRGRGTEVQRAGLLLAGCAAIAIGSIAFGHDSHKDGLVPLGVAWAFTPGVGLAIIECVARDRLDGRALGRWIAWALVAIGVTAFVAHTWYVDGHRAQNLLAGIAVGSFLAGPLGWQWATRGCWRILDRPFMHWFGIRAYGIYLTHVLVLFELRHVAKNFNSLPVGILVMFPLILGISTVLGALSYRWIELPFLQRRLPWRTAKPPAEPIAAPSAAPPEPAKVVV